MFLHFMCMINFVTIQNWNRVSSNLGIIYVILFVAIKAMVGTLGRKVFENVAMWVTIISNHLGYVWVPRLRLRLRFSILYFFHTFWDKFYCYSYYSCTVHKQQPQSLTCQTIFNQSVHTMHCSRTYKFHFSATFSLKISPMVLFTYLKIILLQYFSVFSCIQMDPYFSPTNLANCWPYHYVPITFSYIKRQAYVPLIAPNLCQFWWTMLYHGEFI